VGLQLLAMISEAVSIFETSVNSIRLKVSTSQKTGGLKLQMLSHEGEAVSAEFVEVTNTLHSPRTVAFVVYFTTLFQKLGLFSVE
jgi:hypothetical protein